MTLMKTFTKYAALFTGVASAGLLSGCGMFSTIADGVKAPGTTIQSGLGGAVHGGQQPISGSTLQLYAVGSTGLGSAATPMLKSGSVVTASDGTFSLTGQYTCGSATQVYLVGTGGDAGAGNNSAITLMAALGPCSALGPSTYINMNELTTIAAVSALSPFMSSVTQIGSTPANATGLANAFKLAQVLADSSTGQPAPPPGVKLPLSELNTLADVLAMCVNSSGPGSTTCSKLLSATGASDTVDAALAIAKAPAASSIVSLWTTPSSSAPYLPVLSARPKDFSVMVQYTGSELQSPSGVAIDAKGNAWIANESGSSVVKFPTLSEGLVTSTYTGGGLLSPRGISIDKSGHVWIANTGNNTVVELGSDGSVLSGAGYGQGALSTPVAIANDSAGNVWLTNFYGNTLAKLDPTGAVMLTTSASGSLSAPSAIALDSAGQISVANLGSGKLCVFSNTAALQNCSAAGPLFGATAVAVSNAGNIAVAGSIAGASLTGAFGLTTPASSGTLSTPVAGGGLTFPTAVAYDGAGTTWFANLNTISAFSGTTAISSDAGIGTVNSPAAIAVDASGNVWTANSGDNSISIFVGLGSPVLTPLAANVGP